MASTIKLDFQDDSQYLYCINRFASYHGFSGTRKQRADFMQAKIIDYIYSCYEADVIKSKQDGAVDNGRTETAANLDKTKIVPTEITP